jgi:hypothetical protein
MTVFAVPHSIGKSLLSPEHMAEGQTLFATTPESRNLEGYTLSSPFIRLTTLKIVSSKVELVDKTIQDQRRRSSGARIINI